MTDASWIDGLVVALFPDRARAERGIRALYKAGFSREQIGDREGGMVVTVSAGPRAEEARQILVANEADVGPPGHTAGAATYERRRSETYGRRRTDIKSAYIV